ncbi:MAG: phosphate ABC transporter permease subunit PstC [Rhodospirillales bacterium]
MPVSLLFLVLILLTGASFWFGRARALGGVGGRSKDLHSLPGYYGHYVAIWCAVPALILLAFWLALEGRVIEGMVVSALPAEVAGLPANELGLYLNDVRNLATGGISTRELDPALEQAISQYKGLRTGSNIAMTVLVLLFAVLGGILAHRRIAPRFRARNSVEKAVMTALKICSLIAILTTVGIVLSLIFESARFFEKVPVIDFLFGLEWSPQVALRKDQVGSSGLFGAIPLFAGTLFISFIAMCVAAPVGLLAAVFMSEYASSKIRAWVKPMLEILAGIPTVVYGFFAALTVAPLMRDTGADFGLTISSESALAAGIVMGVMIIPFVSSLSDDVISAVPQSLREGSYGLGATKSETIRQVVFPAALPGIIGGLLLAASRAIGETMIVVMAAGLAANLTANPFEAVTTVTVQIVTLLVGDQEFDSAKTLAAFALGLVLFCVTLCLNIIALHVVNKYREQYE